MEHPAHRLSSFQAGGALREGSLYVERRADAELFEAVERGARCAVIAPRQMGKSSLRRRAERRLIARGARCVSVDMAAIGGRGVTEEQWLHGVRLLVGDRAGQDLELMFLDELDVALGLPLEDLLASLAAALSPRLTFCLLGVTEPERWSRDASAWRVIRPGPFTREEAAAFLPGLGAAGGDPGALLDAVLGRTAGHPYLTQRLCELLVQAGAEDGGAPADRVARAVNDGLLDDPAVGSLRPR